MANTITAEELKKKIDEGGELYLINTLSEDSFEMRHIPKSRNVPNGPQFLSQFEQEVGAPKDAEIIVYCSSNTCHASIDAGKALEEAGYTNIIHYEDGIAGWQDAGYEFEGAVTEA